MIMRKHGENVHNDAEPRSLAADRCDLGGRQYERCRR